MKNSSIRTFYLLFIFFLFNVSIINGQSKQYQLNDTISIPEIVVSSNFVEGELKKVAGGISVLNTAQLEAQNSYSIAKQLNSLPGVYMQNGTNTTNRIVIRGIGSRTPYSSNRIRAYLNDIPLTNGDGVTTIEDIDVDLLGRVELVKGPSSALYGSGLGGAIKLISKPSSEYLHFNYQRGSFNSNKVITTIGTQNNTTNLSASYSNSNSTGFRENNQFNKNSFFFTTNSYFDQTDVSFTLFYVDINAQIPSSIDYETFNAAPNKAASNWLNAKGKEENSKMSAGVSIRHRFTNNISNKTTLFFNVNNEFEHRPFNDLDDKTNSYGIRNLLQFQEEKFVAKIGVELFSEIFQWSTSLLNENGRTILTAINENRNFANIFAYYDRHFNDKLNVTIGLNLNKLNYQFNSISDQGDHSYPFIVSPRIGANFEMNEKVNFYSSISHGFSSPSLEETLLPNGEKNPNLKPEQGVMSELGIRYTGFGKRFFIDAGIYSIFLKNLLVTKRVSEEIFTGINAGKTSHYGLEIQASYSLLQFQTFPGTLRLNSSLTLSENVFVDFVDDGIDYAKNKLPGIPKQTLYSGISWTPISPLSLYLNFRFTGVQYLNDANSGKYDAYNLTDIKFSFDVPMHLPFKLMLLGGVNNIFDEHYASMILVNATGFNGTSPRYFYPGMTRNFYLSIGMKF